MSTNYYPPKPPITSMRLRTEGPHDKLSIFTRGKLAGELVLDAGDGCDFILMLLRDDPLLHLYWGGDAIGTVVEVVEISAEVPDRSLQVWDESMCPFTIGEVLDLRGRGVRTDREDRGKMLFNCERADHNQEGR